MLDIPDTLTGIARQAHLILHGQSLYDAWAVRCKHRAEAVKHYAEGRKHRAEARKHYAEGDKHYAEGHKHWAEGGKHWASVVEAAGLTMEWGDDWHTCTLSNGEVYTID